MTALLNWLKSLFNLAPVVWAAVMLFVILFAFALAHRAHATGAYVQLSGGTTVVRGAAPVLDLAFAYPSGIGPNDRWKFGIDMVGSSTFQSKPAPNNYIYRAGYQVGFGHFDMLLGVSWMQNYLPYNGGNVNMNLELAYRLERWPLTFTYSHFSDAGSRLPNYGRDLLMLGYRFN